VECSYTIGVHSMEGELLTGTGKVGLQSLVARYAFSSDLFPIDIAKPYAEVSCSCAGKVLTAAVDGDAS